MVKNNRNNSKKRKSENEESVQKKKKLTHIDVIRTNLWLPKYMGKRQKPEPIDWNLYDDGWNGTGLRVNTKVKSSSNDKVYCHEAYAASVYKKYQTPAQFDEGVKDLEAGSVIKITSVQLLGGDELLVGTSTGNAAIINLAKENKFFEMIGETKNEYKAKVFGTPEGRQAFVNAGFMACIGRSGNASLYDGVVYKTKNEFMEQIALGRRANKPYMAHIESSNSGGYICTVNGIRCFLPGSQATSNVLTDFDNLIGKDIEVMPFRYIEGTGFLVSRKKYLQRVIPDEVAKLKEYWKQNPDRIYEGTVTGPGRKLVSQPGQPREYGDPFGIFVELSEFYTGLLHHTYMVDDSAEHMLSYKPGDKIKVQIYTITDDNRIVFTNIFDKTERDEIVSKREAEDAVRDEAEKKAAAEAKAKREAARQQKVKNAADKTFNGNAINSFADLKFLIK